MCLLWWRKSNKREKKLENKFKNIKIKYIVKTIFDNIETKPKLTLIKLNKNIKERLDINIKDYNKLFEIEIEIKQFTKK